MDNQLFKENLTTWQDFDKAAHFLGISLGVFPAPENVVADWNAKKYIFWTDNSLGNCLHQALEALVSGGVLEKNEEAQYRWIFEAKAHE